MTAPIRIPAYVAEPTAARFHASPARFRGIRGPLGSGKSVSCVQEIILCAQEQRPSPDGVRRSRWAAVRNTYGELRSTTIRTWVEWVPEEICPIVYDTPIRGRMRGPVGRPDGTQDGTEIDLEILFISMDRPEQVRKLKSLDLTGVWLNEASELPKAALDMATGRIDRYPPKFLGGATRPCVIADTNSMADDHWWYVLAEVQKPRNFEFFDQPPALLRFGKREKAVHLPNPAAENIRNHTRGFGYYLEMAEGKTTQWIDQFILNKYTSTHDGRPVWPEWNEHVHLAKRDLEPYRSLPLYIGIDGGLTPAAVICQLDPNGRLLVLDEVTTERAGVKQMVKTELAPLIAARYPGMQLIVTYDPAMDAPDQSDVETSPAQMLATCGFPGDPAPTNDFGTRREAVGNFMTSMSDGGPGFLLSPRCAMVRKGMNGGYRLARVQQAARTENETIYRDAPVKNAYSHPCEALQYAALRVASGHLGKARKRARPVEAVSAGGWT